MIRSGLNHALFVVFFVLLASGLLLAAQAGDPSVAASPAACRALTSPGELSDAELITFDDLEDGFNIGAHYQSTHGVVFEDSRQARVNATAYGGAQSPPNVAMNEAIAAGQPEVPLTMTFTETLSAVGFWLGNSAGEDVPATVIAYDGEGNEICQQETEEPVPKDHDLFVGFFDEQKRIAGITIDYAASTAAEALDNLVLSKEGLIPPPTITPTPTPTSTPTSYDLVATSVEVTQGLQDLNNSVPLILGKRTFVRFHVRASDLQFQPVEARLKIECIGCPFGHATTTVAPINGTQGKLIVFTAPSRGIMSQSFLFEVPSFFTLGDKIAVSAAVDPDKKIAEMNEGNNTAFSGELEMREVKPIKLIVYSMGYFNNGLHKPRLFDDIGNGLRWMKQAFPTYQVQLEIRNQTYSGIFYTDGKPSPTMIYPSCIIFNWQAALDYTGFEYLSTTRRYTMVDEGGGWMRGCASWGTSSGPTGVPRLHPHLKDIRWDTDGSYGDWYMGHEVAHSYGRPHTPGCDTKDPVAQHLGGVISPSPSGSSAIYGLERFSNVSFRTYDPGSHDFMTYCDDQWPSDITYKALLKRFNQLLPPATQSVLSGKGDDLLLVAGTINARGGTADLYPVFLLPHVPGPRLRVPGPYAIVLRNDRGSELARYPFTPEEIVSEGDPDLLGVMEFVPAVAGMARLELIGPDDLLLAALEPGAAAPLVTLETPNGGEVANGDALLVRWQASDPDGDPLQYQVQYSADGGDSWNLAAYSEGVSEVTIDKSNTPASDQALIRVLASDGLHTGSDTSAAVFTIPNQKPAVSILGPADGTVVTTAQTLGLEGWAYDNDTGLMLDESVRWISSRDGELGTGGDISVTGLSVGTHQITLRADDGQGGVARDSVAVQVVADLDDLPLPDDELVVEPGFLQFQPGIDPAQQTLYLSNANLAKRVGWMATTNAPWLKLNKTTGQTPDQVTAVVDQEAASWADREGVITFTRQGSGQQVQVYVRMTPAKSQNFLPIAVARP